MQILILFTHELLSFKNDLFLLSFTITTVCASRNENSVASAIPRKDGVMFFGG
jgi:hypothetical protein